MRVAIDTNILVDLEKQSERSQVLATLLNARSLPSVRVCVPAIIASERGPGGSLLRDFGMFQQRLGELGLGEADLLLPMLHLDVSFPDHALLSDTEMEDLERRIHHVLFPELPFDYSGYCTAVGRSANGEEHDRRWRNVKCDVQVLWSHIWHKTDILVTADCNFHKATKKAEIARLSPGRPAVHPSELSDALACAAV